MPVNEAGELGFTPCGVCQPITKLLADARVPTVPRPRPRYHRPPRKGPVPGETGAVPGER
jgi:hypothetical protein